MQHDGNLSVEQPLSAWKYFKCSHCSRSITNQTTCTISTLILPRTQQRMHTRTEVSRQVGPLSVLHKFAQLFLVVQQCKTYRETLENKQDDQQARVNIPALMPEGALRAVDVVSIHYLHQMHLSKRSSYIKWSFLLKTLNELKQVPTLS